MEILTEDRRASSSLGTKLSVDRAPSSDGIDIDSCQRVTIRNCDISNGDDCIALKGTKGPLAHARRIESAGRRHYDRKLHVLKMGMAWSLAVVRRPSCEM